MNNFFSLVLSIFIFVTSIISSEKPITIDELFKNFKSASSKTIAVRATVSDIVTTGNSLRMILESNGKKILVDTYDSNLISRSKVGNELKFCAFYLKHKEFNFKNQKYNLPFLITEDGNCN